MKFNKKTKKYKPGEVSVVFKGKNSTQQFVENIILHRS